MRRFVVQFLINAAAIGVVVLLFSLIHVTYTDPTTGQTYDGPVISVGDQPWLFLFSFALLVAILNAVIRPLILLLTGRWLIRSFGILLVVTDVVIIWLASRIDAVDFTLASPSWFWGLVAALIDRWPRGVRAGRAGRRPAAHRRERPTASHMAGAGRATHPAAVGDRREPAPDAGLRDDQRLWSRDRAGAGAAGRRSSLGAAIPADR